MGHNTSHNVFKLLDVGEKLHEFVYLGESRWHKNDSHMCGAGDDCWLYLCVENNKRYLLMFRDDADLPTHWMCAELLEDEATLLQKDAQEWRQLALKRIGQKLYPLYLTNIEDVKHLLPTCSRCTRSFTDKHYAGSRERRTAY